MKILITGGAGYIGSILVPYLLSSGNKVTVVDNFMYFQNSLADCCYNNDFTVVKGDVRDEFLMKDLLKKKAVIPLLLGSNICQLLYRALFHRVLSTKMDNQCHRQKMIFCGEFWLLSYFIIYTKF